MTIDPADVKPPPLPSPQAVALGGLCPRCGAKTLFAGTLSFAPRCGACGLDYESFNVGDGAAAFLILIIGSLVVGLVIWMQLALNPPWWVQALVWIPVATALVIASLRVSKAALLGLEYRNSAREGRRQ